LRLYYGAADTCIAMATGSIQELLDWLDKHGKKDEVEIKYEPHQMNTHD
jgi:hypothetical protein